VSAFSSARLTRGISAALPLATALWLVDCGRARREHSVAAPIFMVGLEDSGPARTSGDARSASQPPPVEGAHHAGQPERVDVTRADGGAGASELPRSMPGYLATGTLPPIARRIGDRNVLLLLDRSYGGQAFVRAMLVDDQPIFPPHCGDGSVTQLLCSDAYRHLGGVDVFGIRLLDTHVDHEIADFLFGAFVEGSSECGAYGFWLIRVDARSLRISMPVGGCFAYADDRHTSGAATLSAHWGAHIVVTVTQQGGQRDRYDLEPRTLTWDKAPRRRP
jgi:hypothetical protein